MVGHEHFQAQQPRQGREQRRADRVNVYQPSAAATRLEHGNKRGHDGFQALAPRRIERDDIDVLVPSLSRRQVGPAPEHGDRQRRIEKPYPGQELLAVRLDAAHHARDPA